MKVTKIRELFEHASNRAIIRSVPDKSFAIYRDIELTGAHPDRRLVFPPHRWNPHFAESQEDMKQKTKWLQKTRRLLDQHDQLELAGAEGKSKL